MYDIDLEREAFSFEDRSPSIEKIIGCGSTEGSLAVIWHLHRRAGPGNIETLIPVISLQLDIGRG